MNVASVSCIAMEQFLAIYAMDKIKLLLHLLHITPTYVRATNPQ